MPTLSAVVANKLKDQLKKMFSRTARPMYVSDAFVYLVQAAEEDPSIRSQLANILRLDSFNRKSLLSTYIFQMKLKKAPSDLIEAVTYLRDDSIAEKFLGMIQKDKLQKLS